MKALISPIEEIKYISSWNDQEAIYTVLGQRVAEITENEFPVAQPLFWIDCNNDVIADLYYYDVNTKSILNKPDDVVNPNLVKQASSNEPVTNGTQTI